MPDHMASMQSTPPLFCSDLVDLAHHQDLHNVHAAKSGKLCCICTFYTRATYAMGLSKEVQKIMHIDKFIESYFLRSWVLY
jgi:hypothetical protein